MRGAALLLACALALSACNGGESDPTAVGGQAGSDMRGAAGAAGMSGVGGAGGYVPDPAVSCGPAPTGSTQYPCDDGGGNAPTFNAQGTQCFSCPVWPVPDTGCVIHYPMSTSGGGTIVHPPHDAFCAPACDPTLCHVK